MTAERALVIAACGPGEVSSLPDADLVIAADSGVDTARRLGRHVDVVVGDLDSISADGLEWAESIGSRIEQHPERKDETDLELALGVAVAAASNVHVVGSAGGRLDHAFANLVVLASARWAPASISATIGNAHVDVVRGRRTLGGEVGDLVSLLPVGGVAGGVQTSGLEYVLDAEDLDPTSARAVSNLIVDPPPVVRVATGVVLAIRPLARSSDRGPVRD